MNDEIVYKLFKAIESNADTNQRILAAEIGVSLGKLHYCLKALLKEGFVKAENFINRRTRRNYLYQLTPSGIKEKIAVTIRFLNHKKFEYERLRLEITELERETRNLPC